MRTFTILNAVAKFGSFEALIMQNANLIKELDNFMTPAGARPNMAGALGMRKMKVPNRLALR